MKVCLRDLLFLSCTLILIQHLGAQAQVPLAR